RTHCVGKVHLTPYGLPNGADPATLHPADHPEAHDMWNSGKLDRVPANYYGLETCEISLGHSYSVGGDYRNWVRQTDPAAMKYFTKEGRALRNPTGADQCHPWAMPEELHHSTWCANRTIAFLEEQVRAEQTAKGSHKPFFTFCSFPDPHHAYAPCAPWADLYKPADVQLPRARRAGEFNDMPPHYKTTFETGMLLGGRMRATKMPDEHLREIIALTYGMIGLIDKSVGRVLDALTRLKLDENTVVLYLSDHGDLMGDHWMHNKGPFLYRGLTRVPFLVSTPQTRTARKPLRVSGLTSHLDFAPTILDLAGVPIPEGPTPPKVESPLQAPAWPGRSLAPVLAGKTPGVRNPDRILLEYDEDYLGSRLRALLTPEFRVVLYAGEKHGELFDLKKDPDELHNLWADPAAKALKSEALAQLADELALTDSPLPRRFCHA
ncbi:MAG TPA: sulfatase-like hydrolase/transferase, partial [Planctomycetota bacterium]|nr:sulfatase-like hydrolase/transferase [Planctomycetota bacterium]